METSVLETAEEYQKQKIQTLEKIRPDLNLEKWPIFAPAHSRTKKARTITRVTTLPNGAVRTSRVSIDSTERLGTLTTEEKKTFYALLKLWEKAGRPKGFVPLALRQVVRERRRTWGTPALKRTLLELRKLAGVGMEWEDAFFSSETNEVVEFLESFHILSNLKIALKRKGDVVANKAIGYFKFNDLITDNLLSNHTKPLLTDVAFDLQSELAFLIYCHLDLIMARRDHYERKTRELFFDDLLLDGGAYKNPSKRKQNLLPAIKELQGVQLTTGYISSIKLERTVDGKDYKIVVDKGQHQPLALIPETDPDTKESREVQSTNPPQPSILGKQARDLVVYFHKLFHGTELSHPNSKAINQATALIAQHGNELARFIVEFAHTEAPKTNYNPQTFGGILHYTSRAVADRDRARVQEKAHTRIAQCTFCDSNGFIFFEDERHQTFAVRCPHDPDTITTKAEARNWHHPKLSHTTTPDLQTTPTS
jgi:hypothetical protein